MEQSRTVDLTKKLLHEYYELGNIVSIKKLFTDDVIVFGVHSESFATGKKKAELALRQMHQSLNSCRVTKIKCVEKASDDGVTVRANVIFSTSKRMRNMQQALVIYRDTGDGCKICGIHIRRDIRHELTYQMISSCLLNHSENKESSMDEVMDMVASYVNCAYVQYCPDKELPVDYYSEELWRMLGYKTGEEYGRQFGGKTISLEELIHPHDLTPSRAEIKRQLLAGSSYQAEYRLRCQDNGYIWCMECGRYVLDSKTGAGAFHAVITNLSPLKQTHATFLYSLRHDRLTGLYNKKAFCRRTAEILEQYPDTAFEIMRFNIARFKVINDLFGEETGDKLLKYVAHFLKSIKLEPCAYGRLYADNFLLCYPTQGNVREHLIHSLQMLAESFALDYRIDFYFGIYAVQDTALAVTTMLDRAAMGLSRAQNNGLIVCGEYDEAMRDTIVSEQVIVNNMNGSLERGEFLIYLQPKYELMSEKIVGAEALVRWLHPQLGFISPSRFIPVFEQNGFIYQLDKYVWEQACKILRSDMDKGRPALPISVNVSRIDLYSPNIVQVFEQLIKKYDIPPKYLELELTESAYVENPQQIIEIAKELQSRGFPILMDDFGSGYSSLNMLKDMPVDILKIDLKFLSDTQQEDNGRGGNILNSVVRMAKWLHIPVIAEGVESQQQIDFLRTIGCECVQGFFYSKPVPVDVYAELVDKGYSDTVKHLRVGGACDSADMMTMSAQLTVLFNSSRGAIGLYELVGRSLEILRVNDGYFKMFGDPRDKVYGPDNFIVDRIEPEDRDKFWQAISEAQSKQGTSECEIRRRCSDGRIVWIRVRSSIIFVENLRTLLYLVMDDITTLAEERVNLKRIMDHLRSINPQEVAALEQKLKNI